MSCAVGGNGSNTVLKKPRHSRIHISMWQLRASGLERGTKSVDRADRQTEQCRRWSRKTENNTTTKGEAMSSYTDNIIWWKVNT